MTGSRSSLQITLAVWQALFLRETVSRIASGRAAWAWLLLEPVVHAIFVLVLFMTVRMHNVAGADVVVWLLIGYVSFFTARNIYSRGMEAVNANQALFAYRQVLPVDSVLARAALEAFLGVIVLCLLMVGVALMGHRVFPDQPLLALSAYAGLCLSGLGLGLVLSVASELLPEVGKVFAMLSSPLYLLSGVMIPLALIPEQYRSVIFLNPFAHGIELLRAGFFPYYHVAPEASLGFLYGFALAVVFLGLSLHVRFASSLRAQ